MKKKRNSSPSLHNKHKKRRGLLYNWQIVWHTQLKSTKKLHFPSLKLLPQQLCFLPSFLRYTIILTTETLQLKFSIHWKSIYIPFLSFSKSSFSSSLLLLLLRKTRRSEPLVISFHYFFLIGLDFSSSLLPM